MRHEPERDAAAYLGGAMRVRRSRRFEEHLIDCEDCWREVETGRLGRRVAESARELAPQSLRETIRASVAAAAPQQRRHLGRPVAGALALVLAAGAFGAVVALRPDQPAPIAHAVADFRDGRMPSEAPSSAPAPDLRDLNLTLTSAGSGDLNGLHVDAYSYRDSRGRRLLLYLSATTFPVAAGARQVRHDGPWRARVGGVELLCSSEPHAMLAMADDAALLDALAAEMAIADVPGSV